jgi:peptidoglycan hydrolase-like protein with peptidoglycan-binding domain
MSQLDYIVAECNKRASQAVAPVAPVIPTPPPASRKPRLIRWLRRGSTGSNVVYLQSVLGLKRDGQFGPITEARVRQFQREQGIKVDGIVGWVTWGRLP